MQVRPDVRSGGAGQAAPTDGGSAPGVLRSGYRPHLDGVRAVAVLLVVLYHLGIRWVPGGFIGVDVFFVLSGYLITGGMVAAAQRSSGRGGVSLGRFYARRVRRLLPAAAATILAVVAISPHVLDAVQREQVGRDATAAALAVANWRFAFGQVDYFTPGDVPSPLLHFWSLAVEEQFYLLWPAVFVALWAITGAGRRLGALVVASAGLCVVGLVVSLRAPGSTVAYFGTHTRAYQLLAGATLALAAAWWAGRSRATARPWGRGGVGIAAAVAAGALGGLVALAHGVTDATGYPGRTAVLVTGLTLLLVGVLDLGPASPATRAVGAAPAAGLGRLSYSLYLWHWPVIVLGPLVAARFGIGLLAGRPGQVAVMALLAVGSYRLVERPVRFGLLPRAPAPAVIGAGIVATLVVSQVGVPVLMPSTRFEAQALEAVGDLAEPGACPYFREQWGAPSRSEPCVYRRGSGPTVAVVGDSHAQQWQPAWDAIAEEHDLTIVRVTRRGCPANWLTIYALDPAGMPHTDVPCSIWRDRTYRLLVERYDPDVIYVETRSHEWKLLDGERRVTPDDPDHLRVWADAWEPTLDVLTAGSGRVVVSRTMPNIAFRVPACLADHGEGTTACDMPLAGDPGVVPYNRVIDRLGRGRPDVVVVDPTPIACPDRICPALIGGTIVHRDDDHLTASFAAASAGAFERMLADAGIRLG